TSNALKPAPESKAPVPVDLDEISSDTTDGGDYFDGVRSEGGKATEGKAAAVLAEAEDFEIDLGGKQLTGGGESLVRGLKEFAAEHSMEPDTVNALFTWYEGAIGAEIARRADGDKAARKATKVRLTEEWGDAFADQKAMLDAKIAGLDKSLRKA